jgi:UDP-apiose/xylose synthase
VNLVTHVLPKCFIGAPLDVVQLNLYDCMNVIRACIRQKKRLLHFSTCEVYGKTGERSVSFEEDQSDCILGPVANHRWIYSNAKQLLDRIIHAHGLRGDLEYTIVRSFNFVGPMMDW